MGKKLLLGSCVSSCPERFKNVENKCTECKINCKDCEKFNTEFCISCYTDWILYENECY